MSKFENSLAEAAYLIANHGFAEQEAGTVEESGWHALVVVSRMSLMNLGAPPKLFTYCAEEFHDLNFGEVTVWITENEAGFVNLMFRDSIGTEIREVWEMAHPNT